jgi:hypothetical protein
MKQATTIFFGIDGIGQTLSDNLQIRGVVVFVKPDDHQEPVKVTFYVVLNVSFNNAEPRTVLKSVLLLNL